jgi:hypothetical protein
MSDVWLVRKHENPFSGEITEWIVRNGTYADLEDVVVVLRAQQEEIERLRSGLDLIAGTTPGSYEAHLARQCLDGLECKPFPSKIKLPSTEYFYAQGMVVSMELKEHGGDGK